MQYLTRLTAQLALGAARLPGDLVARHGRYLAAAQRPDGGFAGRAGSSDPYYASFGVRGLALTGRLDEAAADRAGRFLRQRWPAAADGVELASLIIAGAVVEAAAGDHPLDALPRWRALAAARLARLRRDDGGYARSPRAAVGGVYPTFLALVCLELLGVRPESPERTAAFLFGQQGEDGGFRDIRAAKRGGVNPTAAATAALRMLGRLNESTAERAVAFLASMQTSEGGFRAHTRVPVADLLSTYAAIQTLADAGKLDRAEAPLVRRYVLSLADPEGGFRGAAWDAETDVEYTVYGLATLALLAAPPA